ncbi:MAG: Phenylalanine-tRNA ligase alpha subunit [Berkelbacteria bacterium GW2011_GWA1_36_9]|uniref:phenylalanine--tRNA ligase n=1 Tax=Berkelbacteria bacterium GW2011_GWA1_36_9 TaxID=1618331 RepID=A0A0G0IQL6_9BACT|nr:MAG: Phenylalanine-tRNA ligase alpha subunit [Berkelbacteria bacterium GW2011_GWA1_36_9]
MIKGHLHPLTQVERELVRIFSKLGFEVVEGPLIESEWYNFDALNIAKDHPARDMQDTFSLKNLPDKVLRTHTSAVQVAYMEKHQPPFRIVVPGEVFRRDALDASHSPDFYQIEALMVDKNVTLADLKGTLSLFIKEFFGENTKIRWRPGYFSFVEPGMEVDISCTICSGKGCPTCKKTGWVELLGAGMVHPNVFKSAGYDLDPPAGGVSGFAFGVGLDRLVMMKYNISDIRLLYSGDLRFLKQF